MSYKFDLEKESSSWDQTTAETGSTKSQATDVTNGKLINEILVSNFDFPRVRMVIVNILKKKNAFEHIMLQLFPPSSNNRYV